jgi:mono/diheme cytochrome c family protein
METGRPVEIPASRFAEAPYLVIPSGIGAHAWHPMSYSPLTGLVYIPAMQVPSAYLDDTNYTRHIGRWNTGVVFLTPPEGLVPGDTPDARRAYVTSLTRGTLLAWDPVKQEARWQIEREWPWNGGTLATAGNLVFQGTPDGLLHAYAADTGRELWSFDSQRGIMAGPVSFRANGEQYIAVLAGYGGSMGMATQTDWMRRPPPNGMLLAFKIGGTAQLNPLPPITPRPFVRSPGETFTAEQVAEGQAQYLQFCTICHGGPTNPDLFRSPVAASGEAWHSIVMDGALAQRGMISFAPWIDAAQSEAIRAYVLDEARKRATAQAAGG